MKCPHCGEDSDKVVDSRVIRGGSAVRRRRECLACAARFTTYEYVEVKPFLVVKKDGRRVPYERFKIVAGIAKACEKRPASLDEIEALVEDIERKLAGQNTQEVPTHAIGQEVMDRLRQFDEVAYVRYASVYRSFSDLEEFLTVLRRLQADKEDAS